MRPQSAPLARATCRSARTPRTTPCVARSFGAASQTNPLGNETHRPALFFRQSECSPQQKRFITQQWLKRVQDGKDEWARHAKEIKDGKRKSFAAHLEERGLIHDVVGYVLRFEIDRTLCHL